MIDFEHKIERELHALPPLSPIQPPAELLAHVQTAVAQENRRLRRSAMVARFARPLAAAVLVLATSAALLHRSGAAPEPDASAQLVAFADAIDNANTRTLTLLDESWLPTSSFGNDASDSDVTDFNKSMENSLDLNLGV